MSNKIIAIDFDGTVVDHRFPHVGDAVPGAFCWMRRWQELGARLILWTMRSDGRTGDGQENGPVLTDAVTFCRENGMEFWAVNENPDQKSWTASPKVYAHVYVDDAAAGCPLRENPRAGGRPYVNWDAIGPTIESWLLGGAAPASAVAAERARCAAVARRIDPTGLAALEIEALADE